MSTVSPQLRRFAPRDGQPGRLMVMEVAGYSGDRWLVFYQTEPSGPSERRRLRSYPTEWSQLDDDALQSLYADAVAVDVSSLAGRAWNRVPERDVGLGDDGRAEVLRECLEIANAQIDALALALADREIELENLNRDLLAMNAEIQAVYERQASKQRRPWDLESGRLDPGSHANR